MENQEVLNYNSNTQGSNDSANAAISGMTAIDYNELMARIRTKPLHRKNAKVGRNDPCPCGSGKKYKNCCMNSGNYEGYEN